MTFDRFDRLVSELSQGGLSRRSFVQRAVALGISGPAIAAAIAGISSSGHAAAQEATSGGTLRFALGPEANLNPIGAPDGANYLKSLMYDGLVINSANWDDVEPALAESWDLSSDNLTYRFHLRQGVHWHDGQPFTSADVEFTYKIFLTKAVSSAYANHLLVIEGAQAFWDGTTDQISGINVIDDHTIDFTLTKPNAPFLFSVLTFHSILPMHLWQDKTPEDLLRPATWESGQIGTGPFKFSTYEPDRFLEFVRNDDSWRGAPLLDKIVFARVGTTPEATAAALEIGDIDFAPIPASEIERMSELSNISVTSKRVYNIRRWAVNCREGKLSDKRVRQALNYGIDRRGLCEAILPGVSEPADGIAVSPKWANTNLPPYPYDPDKAKALLEEAGWDFGKEIQLALAYQDQGHKDLVAAAQQQLIQIGLNVTVAQLDSTAYRSIFYEDATFDVVLGGTGISPDMDEFKVNLSCDAFYPAGQNGMAYCNPRVDELFELGATTLDFDTRKQYYDELQAILADELPWIPIYFLKIAGGISNRVQGPTDFHNAWNRPYNWNIEKVWVDDGQ